MIQSALKAIRQLPDPAFRKLLLQSLGLTVLLLLGIGAAAFYGIGFIPEFETGWLNDVIGWLAGLGVVIGSIWLLIPVTAIFIGIFLDQIADAVEAQHYPADPPSRDPPLSETLIMALRFTAIMVVANILVLPLYLLPVANLAIFYGLNGYLLGREYFEMVAIRHHDAATVKALRQQNSLRITLAGILIALPLVIPVFNLIVPLFGAAFMVHVYKGLASRQAV
ncbi:MAG TPA: cysteine biosynthesis protein CysZ [Alphaproteobacteria bacterium]|jgi:CysZ protein|nr:cysteine biosynthesis protein CysZ [Alphaproteobacteria bacterium]HBA43497.1 cysteine biosynthesis protein CysZ [Alphaproteobacteria bacterium]